MNAATAATSASSTSRLRLRFAGTATLVRLYARLDRIKQTVWIAGIGGLAVLQCVQVYNNTTSDAELRGVSPQAVLAEQAALVENSPTVIALSGPTDALTTYGGRFAFELGAMTLAIIAVMNVFLVVRHTRADEETDRSELLRSGRVGVWAPLTATGVWAIMVNLALATLIVTTFAGYGVPAGQAATFGVSILLCGVAFAAATMVWAQVFEFGRQVIGAGVATTAFAFAIRAIGDVQGSWLIWLSPIAIAQHVNAFGSPRPQTLVVLTGFCLTGYGLSLWIAAHRDVGSGLMPSRSGAAHAAVSLCSSMGLAWRLQRASIVGWTIGLGALGAMYGALTSSVGDFVESSESIREMVEQWGLDIDNMRIGFMSLLLGQLALFTSGACLAIMLRVRTDERAGRAEPLLAASVSRRAWAGSHVGLAIVAAPVIMSVIALTMTLTDGLMTGAVKDLGDVWLGAIARVPAIWLLTGIGFALYGLGTRWALAAWGLFFAYLNWTLLVIVLSLPDRALNLSPFSHLDHLPATNQGPVAIVVITALAVVAFTAGFTMLDRRDIG